MMKEPQVADSLEALFEESAKKINSNSPTDQSIASDLPIIASIEELNALTITTNAYAKIKCVIQTAFDVMKHAVESYWLLLGDQKRIVRDIIVPEQSISAAYVRVDAEKLLEILPEIHQRTDLCILGWGHSHGSMSVFFSGTDVQNQERVFNETSNYSIMQDSRIKFSFGSTFNIREEKYAEVIWQDVDLIVHKSKIPVNIIKEIDSIAVDLVAFRNKIVRKFH